MSNTEEIILIATLIGCGILFAFLEERCRDKIKALDVKDKSFSYFLFHISIILGGIFGLLLIVSIPRNPNISIIEHSAMIIIMTLISTIPFHLFFKIYMSEQKKKEKRRLISGSTIQKTRNNETSKSIYYIAYFVTVMAVLLFIYFEYNLLYDPIGRTDKLGTHVLNFFICFVLPIILWIAHAIISNNDLDTKVTSKVNKERKNIYGSNYGQTSTQKKASDERIRTETRKRLREAKSDFEEGFLTQEEYQKILDENKPKIL